MKKLALLMTALILIPLSTEVLALSCPDPETTSLKWGVPPEPWVVNPYSPTSPQADENTIFVRANILVAGLGRGITCTYRTFVGEYSIWWQVLTKIPARTDYNWVDSLGGYVCSVGLQDCQFFVAQ